MNINYKNYIKSVAFSIAIITLCPSWATPFSTPTVKKIFPQAKTPLIVWLNQKEASTISLVGGKGASLSFLQSTPNIQVPEGFIITTEAYKQMALSNILLQKALMELDELSALWLNAMIQSKGANTEDIHQLEKKISNKSEEARHLILNTPLSQQLSEQLLNEYQTLCQKLNKEDLSVAIRSSSTAEDLPNASFAGQHDTFLNQRGNDQVMDSIKATWASLFHPHTVQYRNQLRLMLFFEQSEQNSLEAMENWDPILKHRQVSIAVIVQRIIEPLAAGVGFNVNPEGEPKIHIEANYGLGETVVSGLVTPDAWEVDSEAQKILSAQMGDKTVEAVNRADGGVEFTAVEESKREKYALTNETVLEIAKSIRDISSSYEKLFNYKYIDTEFAVDEFGQIYFLQARPETVFSSMEKLLFNGILPHNASKAKILYFGGASGYPGAHYGKLVHAATPEEALEKIQPGDILVTKKTTPDWSIIFPKLGGIIVDIGGVLSHTAIVGREQRIPTILSAENATKTLAALDGKMITIDSINGIIYDGKLELVEGTIQEFRRDDLEHDPQLVKDLEIQVHHTDEEGKWMSRPNKALSKLQLDFLQRGYDQISNYLKLSVPIQHKVIDQTLYVKVEEPDASASSYVNISDQLFSWDLDDLEELFNDRTENVKKLIEFAAQFKATPDQLKEFQTLYQNWSMHYLLRGRFGHGAVAMLMQKHLHKVPDPATLSSYLNLRYPMPNETTKMQETQKYLTEKLATLGFHKQDDLENTKILLQKNNPKLWEEISLFASLYEHENSDSLTQVIPIDLVMKKLLHSIGGKESKYESLKLTQRQIAQMDALFAQNRELARIMILAHKHLFQKENEHHWIARASHRIHSGLLALGEKLVEKRVVNTPTEVFDLEIQELIQLSESLENTE